MVSNLKSLFKPTNKDIRKRIYFTLFALTVFKIGTSIQVPGTEAIPSLGFLELLNSISGGAMQKFSIFGLGVMPYISASIIISILQKDIVPYLTELGKQGEIGRQKLNTITRYLGIILALFEGYAMSYAFVGQTAPFVEHAEVALILTAGTCFLLWIGDQITQKGIGNGVSLIIMAGIISTLPAMISTVYTSLVDTATVQTLALGITELIIFILVYFAIVIGVIYEQKAERRVPIQYSNKTSSSYNANQSYLPFKINSASVMPVIFAGAIMSIPSVLSYVIKNEGFNLFIGKYLTYTSISGFIFYITLIFFFTFFYTFLMFQPKEIADNLQKSGGYIPGIKPGKETTNYMMKLLSRLTFTGAVFISLIAGLPIVFNIVTNLPSNVTVGGTGLLIVVGVALETYNQLESSLISRNYVGGTRRRRNR